MYVKHLPYIFLTLTPFSCLLNRKKSCHLLKPQLTKCVISEACSGMTLPVMVRPVCHFSLKHTWTIPHEAVRGFQKQREQGSGRSGMEPTPQAEFLDGAGTERVEKHAQESVFCSAALGSGLRLHHPWTPDSRMPHGVRLLIPSSGFRLQYKLVL